MNIIEAITSGKRFKNPDSAYWLVVVGEDIRNEVAAMIRLRASDIARYDWIVEEKKVEITYERLHQAIWNALPIGRSEFVTQTLEARGIESIVADVAKKLGLL